MKYMIVILLLLFMLALFFSIYYKSKFDTVNEDYIKLGALRRIELEEKRVEYERQMKAIKEFEGKRLKIVEKYNVYNDKKIDDCDEKLKAIMYTQELFYGG